MTIPRSKKTTIYRILIILCLGLTALIILMMSPLNPFCLGDSEVDSSVFKYVALAMSRGQMPYRDTFDHKGPLLYILEYVGMLLTYYRGVWLIEFVFMTVFLGLMYLTARVFCGRFASFALVILCISPMRTFFAGGNLSEEYALVFIAAALYIFIDYFLNNRISRIRLFICGLCLGAVLMLRYNMAAIWVVFCIAVLIKCIRDHSREWFSFLIWFVAGMAVVILPLLVWLFANGALGDFFRNYILFNLKYTTDETRASMQNRIGTLGIFLENSLVLGSIVINIFMIFRVKNQRLFHGAYLIAMFLSLVMVSMSGQVYWHYGMILIPLLTYPFAWLFGSCLDKSDAGKICMAVFLATLVYPNWETIGYQAATMLQKFADHETEVSPEVNTVLDLIVENTNEGDPIQVIGNQDIWYVRSGHLSASKYSYQDPIAFIDGEIQEEFQTDLKEKLPKVVIMTGDYEELFVTAEKYDCVYENEDWDLQLYLLAEEGRDIP